MTRTARIVSVASLARLIAALVAAVSLAVIAPAVAHADSGEVYSCTVHPTYTHPVTGKAEDAGGSSAAATGQAMAESCVSSAGMMEVTDSGECFLTIRLSLVDLTSQHSFLVQDRGESGWSTPAMGVTATGSDRNGTTNDVCIQLPSKNGIVRASMFVESMGREVVFFVYADGLRESAPSGFTAAIVTEPPAVEPAEAAEPAVEEQSADEPAAEASKPQPQDSDSAENAVSASTPDSSKQGESSQAAQPETSQTQSADAKIEGSGVATAQGLSLSTAKDVSTASISCAEAGSSSHALGLVIVVLCALLVVAGGAARTRLRTRGCQCNVDPDDYSAEYLHE